MNSQRARAARGVAQLPVLAAWFVLTSMSSAAAAKHVIVISVDGMGSAYVTPLLTAGLTNELKTFKRFQAEGSGTLNARDDYNYAVTLPNHVTMMTSRGVTGATGHGWTLNDYPDGVATTLKLKKGSYVASGFDVAHDNALRTGIWAGKTKFALFQQSYSATASDNGMDKIDYDYVSDGIAAVTLTKDFTDQMAANPFHFAFLHYQDPDKAGHASGWSTNPVSAFAAALKTVDTEIGKILQMVANSPTLNAKTAVILTADHGGHDKTHGDTTNPLDYTIPFYVWGHGVPAGKDLYTMNPGTRTEPGATTNPSYIGSQPIRNGEAANLALDLLGLEAITGSTIDSAQDLVVTQPSVTLGLAGSPLAEAAGVATVTATLSVPHTLPVTVNLLFSGTAVLAADYTRSGTSIAIPAGSGSGSLTLTAVADAVYESPDKTIVVDIGTVVNATEDGIQQVTATITDDDPDYVPWMAGYYAPPGDPKAQPGADPDHDGMTNQQEYAFGLDPSSGSSANPIKEPLDKTTGRFTYSRRKPALTRLTYIYQYSTTLSGTWNPFIPVGITSDNGDPVEMLTVEVPAALLANPLLFVRVKAE